jgi:hypothetical protein
MATSKDPRMLHLDNYQLFTAQFVLDLIQKGDSGACLGNHLKGLPYQLPSGITLKTFILVNYVTLYEYLYPEDKTRRRTTSLQAVPPSDGNDDDDDDDPSLPSDSVKSLEKRLGEKRVIELIFELDKYKVALNKELRALFGYLINNRFSSELLVALKADPGWFTVLFDQDVFSLMDLAKRLCTHQAGDKIGSIMDELENNFQLPGHLFAEYKGSVDDLLANLTLHQTTAVENQKAVRWLMRGVDPEAFDKMKEKYHVLSVYSPYSDVCSDFQSYEDALKVGEQERVRYHLAVSNNTPSMAGATGLLASPKLPLNDKGT